MIPDESEPVPTATGVTKADSALEPAGAVAGSAELAGVKAEVSAPVPASSMTAGPVESGTGHAGLPAAVAEAEAGTSDAIRLVTVRTTALLAHEAMGVVPGIAELVVDEAGALLSFRVDALDKLADRAMTGTDLEAGFMREVAVVLLESGDPLPPAVRQWLVAVLRGVRIPRQSKLTWASKQVEIERRVALAEWLARDEQNRPGLDAMARLKHAVNRLKDHDGRRLPVAQSFGTLKATYYSEGFDRLLDVRRSYLAISKKLRKKR